MFLAIFPKLAARQHEFQVLIESDQTKPVPIPPPAGLVRHLSRKQGARISRVVNSPPQHLTRHKGGALEFVFVVSARLRFRARRLSILTILAACLVRVLHLRLLLLLDPFEFVGLRVYVTFRYSYAPQQHRHRPLPLANRRRRLQRRYRSGDLPGGFAVPEPTLASREVAECTYSARAGVAAVDVHVS